jgi:hypothetical protein
MTQNWKDMFKNVDIIEELTKERAKQQTAEKNIIDQATSILNGDLQLEKSIENRLINPQYESNQHSKYDQLDTDLIFSEHTIENICTKYRLRFLPSHLFLGEIPKEAKAKIKKVEKENKLTFESFKIVAPESRFKLRDATEDPILFADLGNGNYYMIHKWGDDMGWYRNAIHYPMRNITTLGLTAIVLGLLTTLVLPNSLFPQTEWSNAYASGLTKIYMAFVLSGFYFVSALIIGILKSKEFSQDVWKSKFFN